MSQDPSVDSNAKGFTNYSPSFESLDEDDFILIDDEVTPTTFSLNSCSLPTDNNNHRISDVTNVSDTTNNGKTGKEKEKINDTPVKYCKYELFGICKCQMCDHSHDIKKCEYISARKMNASNKDMSRIISLIVNNPQIEHLNFGRNQLSKKAAQDICSQIMMSNKHTIKSLAVDSTFIGRQGFKSILECGKKLPKLKYLDLSDLNLMASSRITHNNKNKNNISNSARKHSNKKQRRKAKQAKQQSKQSLEMSEYQRKEVIDTIVQFLSFDASIEHLILGHNDFTFDECEMIIYAAIQYGGLITLDLYGNDLTDEELYHVDKLLFTVRKAKLLRLLLDKNNNFQLLPNSIALIICDYVMSKKDSLYRCHKWSPSKTATIRNKFKFSKNRRNDHPSVTYKRRSL